MMPELLNLVLMVALVFHLQELIFKLIGKKSKILDKQAGKENSTKGIKLLGGGSNVPSNVSLNDEIVHEQSPIVEFGERIERLQQDFICQYEKLMAPDQKPLKYSPLYSDIRKCWPDVILYQDVVEKYPYLLHGKKIEDINWKKLGEQFIKFQTKDDAEMLTVLDSIILLQKLLLSNWIDYTVWGQIVDHFIFQSDTTYAQFGVAYDQIITSCFRTQFRVDWFKKTSEEKKVILSPPRFCVNGSIKNYYSFWVYIARRALLRHPSLIGIVTEHMQKYGGIDPAILSSVENFHDLEKIIKKFKGNFTHGSLHYV